MKPNIRPLESAIEALLNSQSAINIGRHNPPYYPSALEGLFGNWVTQEHKIPGSDFSRWAPIYDKAVRERVSSDPQIRNLMRRLKGRKLYCPGCKGDSCKPGKCHGSILTAVIEELNSPRNLP